MAFLTEKQANSRPIYLVVISDFLFFMLMQRVGGACNITSLYWHIVNPIDQIIALNDWRVSSGHSSLLILGSISAEQIIRRKGFCENYQVALYKTLNTTKSLTEDFPRLTRRQKHGHESSIFVIFPHCDEEFWAVLNELDDLLTNKTYAQMLIFYAFWPEPVLPYTNFAKLMSESGFGKFRADSDVYVVFPLQKLSNGEQARLTIRLVELYSIKGKLMAQEVNEENSLAQRAKAIRRSDFGGSKISAVVDMDSNAYYPYEVTLSNITGIYRFENGTMVYIFRDIEKIMNFSEEALVGPLINVFPNGTGYGATLELFKNNTADILISSQKYRRDMAGLVSILHPITVQGVRAFCKDPSFEVPSDIYWCTFDELVWICLFGTIILAIILNELFLHIRVTKFPMVRISNSNSSFWIGGWYSLSQRSNITRFLTLVLYLMGVVISCAFSAKLASVLAVRFSMVESFQDLLDKDYQFIFSSTSSSVGYFTKSLKQFYRNRMSGEGLAVDHYSLIPGILSNHKLALLTYHPDFYRYLRHHTNDSNNLACSEFIHFPVDKGFIPRVGFVVPKDSPLREFFNHKILMLKEGGLIHRYNQIAVRLAIPQCSPKNHVKGKPLEFSTINQVGILFIFGVTISLLVLFLENTYFW